MLNSQGHSSSFPAFNKLFYHKVRSWNKLNTPALKDYEINPRTGISHTLSYNQ